MKTINCLMKVSLFVFLLLPAVVKAQVSSGPVIDGKVTDAVWNLVPWQNIKFNHTASIIKDSVDFDAKFKFLWDAKNFYVALKVSDDTLVSKPKFSWEKYNVDGAEIYFDLDNSKNILMPRNANYTKTSYDKNDFQFQLWLDKTAATAKLSALTGYKIDTVRTNGVITGYTMECRISIDSLKANDPNFTKVLSAGSKIGFDVNMTDQDWNYKSEAYFRSQLSWRSRSEQVYHDAVYMGTIQLGANGGYTNVEDTQAPDPVVASTSGTKLVWTKAKDNILAEKYFIFRDGMPYDTISRDTSIVVLGGGKFSVKAVDLYDNVSALSNEVTIADGIIVDGIVDAAYDAVPWEPIKTPIFNKTIKDAADFSAQFKLLWDPKFFYLVVDVKDDSLVMKPKFSWEKYMVDNTEVYFDLDNSKNVLMPRNANYTKTSYDKNDFQYQLWLDNSTAATAKKSALVGYKALINPTGYTLECKFSIDSLKSNDPAFTKVLGEGSVIGFDINVSDNDWNYKGEEYYRNETSWNATSENVYHDAVYMGAIKLAANNKWTSMRDVIAPSIPVVKGISGGVSWNKATDNILAEQYNVYKNGNLVGTVLRDTAFVGAVKPDDKFTVKALDINNNLSAASSEVSGWSFDIDGKLDGAYTASPWFKVNTPIFNQTIKDSLDFSAKFKVMWDTKNVYLYVEAKDDSLVLKPKFSWEKYMVDNTEVYFDLDNSKNILTPRNANYTKTSYDKNDFQYQLWLDETTAATAKKSALTAYKVFRTAGGYNLECKFSLDSLKSNDPNFVAPLDVNSVIGFDINMSDNDWNYKGEPYYRNETSWRATSENVYHDAVYMGAMKLTANNTFEPVDDTTPPTKVMNLVGTVANDTVKLSWSPVTDNILAESYIIYANGIPVDTLLRATNTNIIVPTAGTIDYTVAAIDIHNNIGAASDKATVKLTDIKDRTIYRISVYPNPTRDFVSIKSSDEIERVDIIDASGRVVMSDLNKGLNMTLNIKGLSKSVYLMKIVSSTGKSNMVKLVVR